MILYQEQKLIHTPTKPRSRTKIFNHLHDSLCNLYDSLNFIHLLISSNPLATLGANIFNVISLLDIICIVCLTPINFFFIIICLSKLIECSYLVNVYFNNLFLNQICMSGYLIFNLNTNDK